MGISSPPTAAAAPSAGTLPAAGRSNNDPAHRTAEAFEAVFIGQMTKLMMETAQVSGDFGGGHGEEMFRGVLAEQLGTQIAKGGGIGLAPRVLDEIIRLQGATHDVA